MTCVQPFGTDSLFVRTVAPHSSLVASSLYIGAAEGGQWRKLPGDSKLWSDCAVDAAGAIFGSIYQDLDPAPNRVVGGVERSTDGGATWDTVLVASASGSDTRAESLIALNRDTLLVSTITQVFRSTDGGDTWGEVLQPLGVWFNEGPRGHLTAIGKRTTELYVSNDRGETWGRLGKEQLALPPTSGLVHLSNALALSSSELLVGTRADGGVVCIPEAGGVHPSSNRFPVSTGSLFRLRGDTSERVEMAPVGFDGFTALSSLDSAPSSVGVLGGFRRPVLDCAFRWESFYDSPESRLTHTPVLFAQSDTALAALVREGDTLRLEPEATFPDATPDLSTWRAMTFSDMAFYAVSNSHVWARTEGSSVWVSLADLPLNTDATSIAGVEGGILVGTSDGRISRFANGRWQNVYDGREGLTRAIGMERSRGRVAAWGTGGVLLTVDEGDTWQMLGSGLEARTVTDLLTLGPNLYFAATDDGIWELGDRSGQWKRLSESPDTDEPILALQAIEFGVYCPEMEFFCEPTYSVIAYTESQAYFFDIGGPTGFTDASVPSETTLSLGSGMPTPTATGVRFTLKTPTPATLEAYDLLGRRVWQTDVQTGARSAEWDGSGADGGRVSAGVYLIVLRTESETCTTRAVLL